MRERESSVFRIIFFDLGDALVEEFRERFEVGDFNTRDVAVKREATDRRLEFARLASVLVSELHVELAHRLVVIGHNVVFHAP